MTAGEQHFVLDLPHVVHARVRRAVNLNHVRACAFGDFLALLACSAGRCRRSFCAVECFCQDAGGGCLAAAARTAEKIRVRDFFRLHRVP